VPRVLTRTKNKAGKPRNCSKCGERIEPGQGYYTWSFRYGGTYRRHVTCGRPRQSELTQSKMSEVYRAVEDAETDLPEADSVEAVTELVQGVGAVAQEVADEYREADEAFGGQGATEHAERADELEYWAQELEAWDPSDESDLDASRDEALEAISECPL
jgi:hypothetical protein